MSDPAPPLTSLEEQLDALLVAEIERQDRGETPMTLLTERRRWILLSDDECEALILALARGRHPESFCEADAEVLLDWANQARWHAKTLRQVLAGEVRVDVREGVLTFIAGGDDKKETQP